MPRPCYCDKIPPQGESYSLNYCRLCWLYHNDPQYKVFWDTDTPKEVNNSTNIVQQAFSFIKAATRDFIAGIPRVSDEVYQYRRSICNTCEFREPKEDRCLKCGCYLESGLLHKLHMAKEKCPIEKW